MEMLPIRPNSYKWGRKIQDLTDLRSRVQRRLNLIDKKSKTK
jgi:hypothetical protein